MTDDADRGKKGADRFTELRPAVRQLLIDLRDEDVKNLQDGIEFFKGHRDYLKQAVDFYKSTRTVSRFLRWLLITAIASFITFAQLGEAIGKLLAWISRGFAK